MYSLSRHLGLVFSAGLLLVALAACDAGLEAADEPTSSTAPLTVPSSAAAFAHDDSLMLTPFPLLEQMEREARRAGLRIDPTGYLSLAKDGRFVAGVPIAYAKPPRRSERRRGIPLLVIALADPIDPQQARLFFVHGKQKGSREPTLSIVDPAGRPDRSVAVATAVSALLGPCLGPGTAEGTLETVCKAAGGTVEEECEDCVWFFTCCEAFCVPS